MKKFKKLGSILLAAVMALSLSVPAFAADITTDNSAGTVPVIVTTPEGGDLLFKVTLPTSFDIAVDKNGAVKTTDGLKVTTAVTSSDRMFSGCYSLVGGNSTAFDSTHTDKEYARIDAAGTPGYFTDVNALPVSAVLYDNGELVFQKGSAPKAGMTVTATYDYEDIEGSTDVKPWSSVSSDITTVTFDCGIQPTSTSRWFAGFSNLTTVNGMENLDTSNLTDTREMFSWCSKLSSLDLSSWTPDTTYGSQCNMQGMFIQCNITLHVSEAQYDNWTPMTGYLTEDAGSITFVKA